MAEPLPSPFLTSSYPGRAPVAQLDRAPDYESGGQEFESLRARQHLAEIVGNVLGMVVGNPSFRVRSAVKYPNFGCCSVLRRLRGMFLICGAECAAALALLDNRVLHP
jgi:hypothetical protein